MADDRVAAGRLAGKVALVTGAASGLGLAIATRFVAQGARVLVADMAGDAAAVRAAGLGPAARAITQDVTSEADWDAAVAEALAAFGGLHILVNNAGICVPGTVEATSLADWRRTHAINLDGVFLGCRAALPAIAATTAREGSRGSILNISSISAMVAAANMASYNASKAAVRHLTKSVALHAAKAGYAVTCNSLHPTFIDTPLLDGLARPGAREAMLAKLARQVPVGRVGEPDDVAWAAVYFCSDEAKFVTGAELAIDGGLSAM